MRFRLFAFFVLLAAIVFAQHALAQEVITKRSTEIENFKGKPYYIHFVKQGETLSSIAKAYNISIEEITAENPAIEKGLKADMVLRIPRKAVVETPDAEVAKQSTPAEPAKPDVKLTEPSKPLEKPKEQAKPADDPDFINYQLQKKETLYAISKQYNVTVDEILDANPKMQSVQEGMWIKIPKKGLAGKASNQQTEPEKGNKADSNLAEIVVKQGQTLYGISKLYNISVDELINLNPELSEGLKAGMTLKLHPQVAKNEVKANAKANTEVPEPSISQTGPGAMYNPDNIKTTYKVTLLLPFLLDESTNAIEAPEQKSASEFENFDYMQFYAGFMMAADSLEKLGLHALIQVLDGDKLDDTLSIKRALRKPGMDKMDLIVGPMFATSFTVAARFAKKNKIGIVNPLSRRENIVNGNPYVIKAQVSAAGIATKLSTFICSKYPNANVISVRSDSKEMKSTADEFDAQIRSCAGNQTFKGTLQTSTYATDMMSGVSKKLRSNTKNIILFFSNNKLNVPNFVSLLNPLSKSNDILLIGMDGWEDFDLETEFLVNMNYHQVTTSYVDYESEAVQQFITAFRNKYGAVPQVSKHAFLGYDLGWYFLTSLMWYGNQYIQNLPSQPGNGLQYHFSFSAGGRNDGLQNKDATIEKLQDYKMVKVE